MENIENLISRLITGGAGRIIANPETIQKLMRKGVFKKTSPKTLKESINLLFDERKKIAFDLVEQLPTPPTIAAPAIEFLYNEIRECIVFGLNGAAITLSGILVEFVLKYTIVVKETGKFEHDTQLWDEIENIQLDSTIKRAKRVGLLSDDEVSKLNDFKNNIRNPYSHYNIKKITKSAVWGKVKTLNIKTQRVKEKDIAAKDNFVIQAQAKPYIDSASVFNVFKFADQVVKFLFGKINNLPSSSSNTEQAN